MQRHGWLQPKLASDLLDPPLLRLKPVLVGSLARLSSTLRVRLLVLVAEAAEQEAERPSPVPVASRPRRLVPDLAGETPLPRVPVPLSFALSDLPCSPLLG